MCFLALTKFINADVIDYEDKFGVLQKGIFIPIKANGLFKTQTGHYMTTLTCRELEKPTQKGYTHNCVQYIDEQTRKELEKTKIEPQIVGYLRPTKR